jgi:hypothetical protein
MTRVQVIGIVACAAWLTMNAPSHSQDRAAVVPDMKVLLQNAHVRVQFHGVAVGETAPMHSHPAYVAYVVNAYTGRPFFPTARKFLSTASRAMCFTAVP